MSFVKIFSYESVTCEKHRYQIKLWHIHLRSQIKYIQIVLHAAKNSAPAKFKHIRTMMLCWGATFIASPNDFAVLFTIWHLFYFSNRCFHFGMFVSICLRRKPNQTMWKAIQYFHVSVNLSIHNEIRASLFEIRLLNSRIQTNIHRWWFVTFG